MSIKTASCILIRLTLMTSARIAQKFIAHSVQSPGSEIQTRKLQSRSTIGNQLSTRNKQKRNQESLTLSKIDFLQSQRKLMTCLEVVLMQRPETNLSNFQPRLEVEKLKMLKVLQPCLLELSRHQRSAWVLASPMILVLFWSLAPCRIILN